MKTNLSHEHLAKGSTYAPQVKPDVIHLYLNKSKTNTSTQSKTKLVAVPISRILKENGEICPSIRYDVKFIR